MAEIGFVLSAGNNFMPSGLPGEAPDAAPGAYRLPPQFQWRALLSMRLTFSLTPCDVRVH